MRKLLKYLYVIQEKTHHDEFRRKRVKRRLNPYNPLTYVVMVSVIIVGVIMFGVVGLKNEINIDELKFKWE